MAKLGANVTLKAKLHLDLQYFNSLIPTSGFKRNTIIVAMGMYGDENMGSDLRYDLQTQALTDVDFPSNNLFFSIWLDVPDLTNEHRTQDCIAS